MIVNEGQVWFGISEAVLAGAALWVSLILVTRGRFEHFLFAASLTITAATAIAGGVRVGLGHDELAGLHQGLVNLGATVGSVLLGAGALEAAHRGMVMKSSVRVAIMVIAIAAGIALLMTGQVMEWRAVFGVAALIAGVLAGFVLSGQGRSTAALMMWVLFAALAIIVGLMQSGALDSIVPGYGVVLFHFLMAGWCVMVLRAVTAAVPKPGEAEAEPWKVLD